MKNLLLAILLFSSAIAFSTEVSSVGLVKNKVELALKSGSQDVVKILKLSKEQLAKPYSLLLSGEAVSPGKRGMAAGNNIIIPILVNNETTLSIKISKSNIPGLMKFNKLIDLSQFKRIESLQVNLPSNKVTIKKIAYSYVK